MSARTIRVDAGRGYDVVIAPGLLAQAGTRLGALRAGARLAIVTDDTVAGLYLDAVRAAFTTEGLRTDAFALPPGEDTKTFPFLERTLERLAAMQLDRRDLVVALGGGVIGDLAGLAAGLYKRGIDFVQVPTTLLAMVDSSVGGKTAIDSAHGKNLFGLFHQPRLVLADLSLLASLPRAHMLAGYAEIVKIALMRDAAFFDWLEAHGGDVLAREPQALAHAVARAVALKAQIVAADERETGERALLNLGHTFGHALEAASGYHPGLLHGLAVAAGTGLALDFSVALGLCAPATAARAKAHLTALGFELDPQRLPGAPFDAEALIGYMGQDKKAEAGRLTFVLAREIGAGEVVKGVDAQTAKAFLKERLKTP